MFILVALSLLAAASILALYVSYVSLIDRVAKETRSLSYGLMMAAREFAITTQYFAKSRKSKEKEKERSLDEEFRQRFKRLLSRLGGKK
jgi:predicted Holliday junction resolvase-like endonuclease